uniref:Reverse transcriptase domain-containing protein n=1 Tax=Gadus morhua TaxID=8049 RepID=A0A8C5AMD3_GADMO
MGNHRPLSLLNCDYKILHIVIVHLDQVGFIPGRHAPFSSVKTNGLISKPFPLQRGVRQGCPVSPLLFIMALEPLACAIRSNGDIHGVNIHGHDFKLNMYADDILLTLSKPTNSIHAVLYLINLFGSFSGYKINWNKSEAIPLNSNTFKHDLMDTPFIWKTNGMKYLGINIVSPITKIFSLNGPGIFQSIKEDISRWTAIPLSLWGRAEMLKMNVLPRLSPINSSIPHFLPSLGVPDIFQYYLSFNAKYPLSWAYNNDFPIGSWQWLEQSVMPENGNITLVSSSPIPCCVLSNVCCYCSRTCL